MTLELVAQTLDDDNAPVGSQWDDLLLALELFAVAEGAVGGILLRSPPGGPRDQLLEIAEELTREGSPFVRLPLHVTDDRLLGGLALAATLAAGRPVFEDGLLARADGGVLVVSMAERLRTEVTSHLCSVLDRGVIGEGEQRASARFGVLALDEGIDDERPPIGLADRLALHLDLSQLDLRELPARIVDPDKVARARATFSALTLPCDIVEALCEVADALGVLSMRAVILAAGVARAHAALEGRTEMTLEDASAAARLVLGPRATRLPAPPPPPAGEDEDDEEEEEDADGSGDAEPPPPAQRAEGEQDANEPRPQDDATGEDRPTSGGKAPKECVLEAAKSGIPKGLLERLTLGPAARGRAKKRGQAGEQHAGAQGGRRADVRPGEAREGLRLNIIETLRAAAPWQPLRRRELEQRGVTPTGLLVRKGDFRVTRFQQRTQTCVIFCVDASGSAALERLAEAKGAVEQVLADCYARRDHVALIAFRGTDAALLLPPTRSLARVRKSLANLAGGGTTPLAAGLEAALSLALEADRRGQTPVVVLMTDGRGNIAKDGGQGREAAGKDALVGARALRVAGIRSIFVDTSPRGRPEARALAAEMQAHYVALPYARAAGISKLARSLGEAA